MEWPPPYWLDRYVRAIALAVDGELLCGPIEMTSDELLDYALDPELAEAVKHQAKPPDESTDSEQEC